MKLTAFIRTSLFFCVWLFLTLASHAQQGYEDVVYLKNGGIMRGMIIEQIPNQSLKIQTVGRNVFVFTFDEIEKITKEEVGTPATKTTRAKPDSADWDRGRFTFIVEGNIGFGARTRNSNGQTIAQQTAYGGSVIFAVNLVPKACLGIGAGFDAIDNLSFVPLFVDFRYFFSNRPFTPYVSASAGYGIGPAPWDEGGWYANPNLGLRYNVAPKAGIHAGIGWRLQTEKINSNLIGQDVFFTMNFLNFKVGAIF